MIITSEIRKALENKRRINKSQRTLQVVQSPKNEEMNYRYSLLSLVDRMNEDVQRFIFPALTDLEPLYVQDTPRQDILEILDKIEKSYNLTVENFALRTAHMFVEQVSKKNKDRLLKSFQKSFGISLTHLTKQENIRSDLNDHIEENVALIKTIPEEHFSRIEDMLSQGITKGRTAGDIRNQLREAFDITERRARLIARDQTSKINGNLTAIRAKNSGSKKYEWVGREDDLERPGHTKLNGKIFFWDNPPDTGNGKNHPGQDIQCRCYAKVIIDI